MSQKIVAKSQPIPIPPYAPKITKQKHLTNYQSAGLNEAEPKEVYLDAAYEDPQWFERIVTQPPAIRIRYIDYNNKDINNLKFRQKTTYTPSGPEIQMNISGLINNHLCNKFMKYIGVSNGALNLADIITDKFVPGLFEATYKTNPGLSAIKNILMVLGPIIVGGLVAVLTKIGNCTTDNELDFTTQLHDYLSHCNFKKELATFSIVELAHIIGLLLKYSALNPLVSEIAFGFQVTNLVLFVICQITFKYMFENYPDNEKTKKLLQRFIPIFQADKIKLD